MKEKQIFTNSPSETDNSHILDSGTTPYANSALAEELSAPLPYKKFLPEPTEEVRTLLKNAHGEIKYRGTNNYIFQAFLQENNDALKNLICSVLHMNTKSVKSIVITNPILLGKYIEIKTFILDIKVLLNDNTIINLEMQIENQLNWPERSLGYLCRSFDNLNTGADYLNTKPAIHIGFLDYCLFPDKPEFHATYKLLNVKNHNVYTDKFIINVVDLTRINMATKEDKLYGVDKWAAFFKADKWEDIIMLADQIPSLQTSVETLYQLNTDEQIRETCDRFIRAENRERGYKNWIASQAEEIAKQKEELDAQKAELAVQKEELAAQKEELAKKEEENEYYKSLLAQHGIPLD